MHMITLTLFLRYINDTPHYLTFESVRLQDVYKFHTCGCECDVMYLSVDDVTTSSIQINGQLQTLEIMLAKIIIHISILVFALVRPKVDLSWWRNFKERVWRIEPPILNPMLYANVPYPPRFPSLASLLRVWQNSLGICI